MLQKLPNNFHGPNSEMIASATFSLSLEKIYRQKITEARKTETPFIRFSFHLVMRTAKKQRENNREQKIILQRGEQKQKQKHTKRCGKTGKRQER